MATYFIIYYKNNSALLFHFNNNYRMLYIFECIALISELSHIYIYIYIYI